MSYYVDMIEIKYFHGYDSSEYSDKFYKFIYDDILNILKWFYCKCKKMLN